MPAAAACVQELLLAAAAGCSLELAAAAACVLELAAADAAACVLELAAADAACVLELLVLAAAACVLELLVAAAAAEAVGTVSSGFGANRHTQVQLPLAPLVTPARQIWQTKGLWLSKPLAPPYQAQSKAR